MASIELESARRRLTLAQEEVQRAQASLVLQERHEYREVLTLVRGMVDQALNDDEPKSASARADAAEAALDNVRLALEHAGITTGSEAEQGSDG